MGVRRFTNLLDIVLSLAVLKAEKWSSTGILRDMVLTKFQSLVGKPIPDSVNNFRGLVVVIFLNKEWDVNCDGGELGLITSHNTIAKIPPLFNRVVFYPSHRAYPFIHQAKHNSLSYTVFYTNHEIGYIDKY